MLSLVGCHGLHLSATAIPADIFSTLHHVVWSVRCCLLQVGKFAFSDQLNLCHLEAPTAVAAAPHVVRRQLEDKADDFPYLAQAAVSRQLARIANVQLLTKVTLGHAAVSSPCSALHWLSCSNRALTCCAHDNVTCCSAAPGASGVHKKNLGCFVACR